MLHMLRCPTDISDDVLSSSNTSITVSSLDVIDTVFVDEALMYDVDSGCYIVAQLLPLYLFAFQWGLSNLAALGANLEPSTVPEAVLAILVHGIGFYTVSYIMVRASSARTAVHPHFKCRGCDCCVAASMFQGQVYSIIMNLDQANNHFISVRHHHSLCCARCSVLSLEVPAQLTQDAENWFKLREFPRPMQEQIKRYLLHNFDIMRGMDEKVRHTLRLRTLSLFASGRSVC